MESYFSAALLPLLAWITYKIISRAMNSRHRAPYPPGPAPKPLIANLFDFPQVDAAQKYLEMSKAYNSEILHFEAMGEHIVILNRFEDAEELLDVRAKMYSDRNWIPIIKIMGWDYNFAFHQHNDLWRRHRKIAQQNFRAAEASKYLPVQMEKLHQMLRELAKTPEQFDMHNKKLSIAIPLSTMYGYDITSLDDPVIEAADESTRLATSLVTPGSTFINILPILAKVPPWVPGTYAVRTAIEVKRLVHEMKTIPMEFAKKKMAEGTARPSLITEFLEKKWRVGASPEEEEIMENVANTVYGAASDTTISATRSFFYLIAINPEVQKKAQAELDRVIGQKRLPDINDRSNLPYIEAIYREVMRLCPVLPLGLPHKSSSDDFYKGYFLPKGTLVMANIWAINRNEQKYEDPNKFWPERFFDESGKLNDDDRILAYGFGRRICVGKYLASSTLWLIMASILACFNVKKALDADGNEIEIDDKFEDFGVVRHKAKFDCSFTVRSPEVSKLIADTGI